MNRIITIDSKNVRNLRTHKVKKGASGLSTKPLSSIDLKVLDYIEGNPESKQLKPKLK
jgi:hypothetical protein